MKNENKLKVKKNEKFEEYFTRLIDDMDVFPQFTLRTQRKAFITASYFKNKEPKLVAAEEPEVEVEETE